MNTETQLEISRSIALYAYGFDTRDALGFADVFVDDGVLEFYSRMSATPELRLEGTAAIREWADQRFKLHGPDSQSRHFQTGTVFDEVTATTAQQDDAPAHPPINRRPSTCRHDYWCLSRPVAQDAGWVENGFAQSQA